MQFLQKSAENGVIATFVYAFNSFRFALLEQSIGYYVLEFKSYLRLISYSSLSRELLHRHLINLDFLLSSEKNCKKRTILGSLRTITQDAKTKNKTRQMTPFFLLLFRRHLFVIFIFVFENCQNSFLWSPPFSPFWSAKYLKFWVESCEIRILLRSIQETYTLRKVKKKQVLLFLVRWEASGLFPADLVTFTEEILNGNPQFWAVTVVSITLS